MKDIAIHRLSTRTRRLPFEQQATLPSPGSLIRARAPLRLGLAGGGTDVSPYCDRFGGLVLNAAISKYTYATLEFHQQDTIVFESMDRDERAVYPVAPRLELDGWHDVYKGVYNRVVADFLGGSPFPFLMRTSSDAVAGSGLGSSSALIVAMLQAFVTALSLPLTRPEIAHLACVIERKDIALAGGRQDQYAAALGGFNLMEFHADDRVVVNPLRVKERIVCELESSLVLYFTGVSRDSARIIVEQSANVDRGDQISIEATHALKREALAMRECLLSGDIRGLGRALQTGWEAKKRTADSISNRFIDEIDAAARGAGAYAGKISGAGGGGFMFFLSPAEARPRVVRALEQFGGTVSDCHFTDQGATAWRNQ